MEEIQVDSHVAQSSHEGHVVVSRGSHEPRASAQAAPTVLGAMQNVEIAHRQAACGKSAGEGVGEIERHTHWRPWCAGALDGHDVERFEKVSRHARAVGLLRLHEDVIDAVRHCSCSVQEKAREQHACRVCLLLMASAPPRTARARGSR